MAFGTISLTDLYNTDSQSVVDYGEERLYEAIDVYAAAHNRMMEEQLSEYVEFRDGPDARLSGSGANDTMTAIEVDEFATVDRQKVQAGVPMGYPLRAHQVAIQWTRLYFENATPADIAAQTVAAMTADRVAVAKALRRAFYTPTNTTFTDRRWKDQASLPVKALINADSFPLPPDMHGNTFDTSTHTHYLAYATLNTTALSALIATVREHYQMGTVRVVINHAQASTVQNLSGFEPVKDVRIVQARDTTYVDPSYMALNTESIYDRMIGIYDGAEIWVKPWALAGYVLAYHRGDGARKVLRFRRRNAAAGSFRLIFQDENHPLRSNLWEREFGIAPQERQGAAVMEVGVDTTYTIPSSF